MKKSLLLSALAVLLLALTTGIIYAQVTSTSIVDKMKAVAHSFTLSTSLNPTDTGLTSDPVKGKKTGDILTAAEWNRVLELTSEGGGTGSAGCTVGVYHGSLLSLGSGTVTLDAGGKSVTTYPTASAVITGGGFSKGWRVQPKSDGGVWKAEFSRVGDTAQTVGPLYFDLIYSDCNGSGGGGSAGSGGSGFSTPDYDSGWVDFATQHVQTLTHNLGTAETVVVMEEKGGTDFTLVHNDPIVIKADLPNISYHGYGPKWYNKTASTIDVTVPNGFQNEGARYVRMRIWKTSALGGGSGGGSFNPTVTTYSTSGSMGTHKYCSLLESSGTGNCKITKSGSIWDFNFSGGATCQAVCMD